MGVAKYAGVCGKGHFNGKINLAYDAIDIPLKWKKPRMIFVNSMSDLFHPAVPFEFIEKVFEVMADCPRHTFQVLTKRPERMARFLPNEEKLQSYDWPLPNVWLGTSVEDQESSDERVPHLLNCKAAVRFLSCEPLLAPIQLDDSTPEWWNWNGGIGWIIVGGESGGGARECDIAWIRSIVHQCAANGTPCFVKQLGKKPVRIITEQWGKNPRSVKLQLKLYHAKGGNPTYWPPDLQVRQWPVHQLAEVIGGGNAN